MEVRYFSSSLSDIDATGNPTEFVHYMDDANAMQFFPVAKRRAYARRAAEAGVIGAISNAMVGIASRPRPAASFAS